MRPADVIMSPVDVIMRPAVVIMYAVTALCPADAISNARTCQENPHLYDHKGSKPCKVRFSGSWWSPLTYPKNIGVPLSGHQNIKGVLDDDQASS